MKSEKEIKKITTKIYNELIEELNYKSIKKKGDIIEILVNGKWLVIENSLSNKKLPFVEMIFCKWEKETEGKELLGELDEFHYKNEIRRDIKNYFIKMMQNKVLEKMNYSFETTYLGMSRFKIVWEDKKFIVNKKNVFMEESSKELIKSLKINFTEDLNILLYDTSLKIILRSYLLGIYEQTTEYKLKNMYN
jgi:hypothetical protein